MNYDPHQHNDIGSKVKDMISDPNNIMFELKKKKKDLIFWFSLVIFMAVIYFTLSSGEFSFILVLASIIQMASFFIIAQKVYNYNNSSGLSLNTMICYLLVMLGRLSSTLFYNGYLPSDEAGDWFYQVCEVFSLVLVVVNIFFITTTYKDTAEAESDDAVDFKFLAVPCLILALLVHTSLNKNLITDVAWSFSMYLEGVAIFPQLYLFQKKKGQIESFTSHYVSLQGLNRLLTLIFWYYTYEELNEEIEDSYSFFHTYTGYFLIFSQVIQLLLMVEFYYFYFKSFFKGEKMSISSEI